MRVEQRAVDHEGALALALQLWLFLRPDPVQQLESKGKMVMGPDSGPEFMWLSA
jgi:hypothetical protein